MKLKSILNQPETRGFASLECRALTAKETESGYIGVLTGTIPFNADSQVMQRRSSSGRPIKFVERIAPGAFAASISEGRDIVATAGHAEDPLSAFAIIGENLTITTTERSMDWEAKVPDTSAGRDLMRLVDMKIIRGTSFEFILNEGGETWEKRGTDMEVRTITSARLMEVNPVKWPAYLGTSLTVEMRGRYSDANVGHDYYYGVDSTITGPVAYAQGMLNGLTGWLTNSLEFLRDQPGSELVAFAANHVEQVAAQITELVEWLKNNGAESAAVDTSTATRALEDFQKEIREFHQTSNEELSEVRDWAARLGI